MKSIREVARFLGPRVTGLTALNVVIGVSSFFTELGLGFGIQIFLAQLTRVGEHSTLLDAIPGLTFRKFLCVLFLIVWMRGALEALQRFVIGTAGDVMIRRVRSYVLDWGFSKAGMGAEATMLLYSEKAVTAEMALERLQGVIRDCVMGGLLLTGLLWVAPFFTLIMILILALCALPIRSLNRKIEKVGQELSLESAEGHRRVMVGLQNLLFLRISGVDGIELAANQRALLEAGRQSRRFRFFSAWPAPYFQFCAALVICAVGLFPTAITSHSTQVLIPYLYLLTRFLERGLSLSSDATFLFFYWPRMKEILDWWTTHQRRSSPSRLQPMPPSSTRKVVATPIGWKFENVSFQYPDATEPVFSNLSLQIPQGALCLLRGSSGAGKSTILHLMLSELVSDSGRMEVQYNGASWDMRKVRELVLPEIGYVGAENFFLKGSVRENLTYGLAYAVNDAEIREVLFLCGCDFINRLPKGLEHPINSMGSGLSSGQRQRLALARALLRDPKALILDEPTSNLDEQTTSAILHTLKFLKGEKTIVVASHDSRFKSISDHIFEIGKLATKDGLFEIENVKVGRGITDSSFC